MAASSDRSHELGSEVMAGLDYFFCEKTNCRLRISVCIRRQEANRTERSFESRPFMICEDCPQGMENMNLKPKGGLKLTEETNVDKTTEKAADTETDKTVNTRLCECGKTTISPSSPLCPSCMQKRANKSKREGSFKQIKKKNPEKVSDKSPRKVSSTAIIVEFGDHQAILEQITRDAREQIRTVSGQVIWTLKNAASSTDERRSHEKTL